MSLLPREIRNQKEATTYRICMNCKKSTDKEADMTGQDMIALGVVIMALSSVLFVIVLCVLHRLKKKIG